MENAKQLALTEKYSSTINVSHALIPTARIA
jgi:hypothetical protein